jgi:hypothetical protein
MAKVRAVRIGRRYGWHLSVAAVALVGGGCQSAPGPYGGYPAYPAYDYSAAAPRPVTQAPQQMPVAEVPYQSPSYQALEGTAMELKERLDRVEKAMLRLDRRMQLVERNELSRMNGQTSSLEPAAGPNAVAVSANPAASDVDEAMQALGLNESSGYRPVSSRNEAITSALQAAPSLASSDLAATRAEPVRMASRGGLPSLADPVRPAGRDLKAGQQDVAIWTVRYESGKVWPDRTQLPSSRDVVDVLRENGKANIYARGKNASAVEFRDRVKALSRYLSKVSSLETVPIAAMAAPHLDDETIEIVVTH